LDARNHGDSEHLDTMTYKEMANDVYEYIKSNNLTSKIIINNAEIIYKIYLFIINLEDNLFLMGHSLGAKSLMTLAC
jgi:pimeloyl-ACP methyl ester carboxylesterase